jgi:hypothetical protein
MVEELSVHRDGENGWLIVSVLNAHSVPARILGFVSPVPEN